MTIRKGKKVAGIVAGVDLRDGAVSQKSNRKTAAKVSNEKQEKFQALSIEVKTLGPLFLEIFNKLSEAHSQSEEEAGNWEDETIAGKLAEVHSKVAYAHASGKNNFPNFGAGNFTEQEMAIAHAILGLMDIASYEGLRVGEAIMQVLSWKLYHKTVDM